jgi:S-formylglutathione hydrolase FrmB
MALLETHLYSESLDQSIGASIILPQHAEAWSEPPSVLYLLHGLSGDHSSWCRNSSIERYARDYNLAVVMPDGCRSFYCDMKHGSNYWKFFSEELPSLVNRWFNVSPDVKNTFVAGSSMGGYGAMKLALGCPGQYAAAASLSGALDIAAHINDEWDELSARTFEAVFGDLSNLPKSENDLIAQLRTMNTVPNTDFYVCCGSMDYLHQDSITFRDQALRAGLNLTFEEADGDHEWGFWDTYIQHILEWLPIEKLEISEG